MNHSSYQARIEMDVCLCNDSHLVENHFLFREKFINIVWLYVQIFFEAG